MQVANNLETTPGWRSALEEETEFKVPRTRYARAPMMPEVRRLSRVSNWNGVLVIGTQWVVISLCIALAILYPFWWVWIPCGIILATRLQCLGVLMHDGAHYLLFTNRLVNDIVSDLFLAFPLGLSTTLYRHDHFIHHRYTNTEEDPDVRLQHADEDFRWPKTRFKCAMLVLRSLLGLNLPRMFQAAKAWSPWVNLFTPISPIFPLRARILLILTTILVYTAVIWSGQIIPLLAVFVIPGLTLLNFTNRIRVTAEHMRVPATHELNSTRTVVPNWLECLMVAPYGVSYHIEHHLFPSVPGRNLPELHQHLMRDKGFQEHAHVTYSYRGLLRELLTPAQDSAEPTSSST